MLQVGECASPGSRTPLHAPLQPHPGRLWPAQATLWMPTLEPKLEALGQTPLAVTSVTGNVIRAWGFGGRKAGQRWALVSIGISPSCRLSPGWQLKDLEGALEWDSSPRSLSWPCHLPFSRPWLSTLFNGATSLSCLPLLGVLVADGCG